MVINNILCSRNIKIYIFRIFVYIPKGMVKKSESIERQTNIVGFDYLVYWECLLGFHEQTNG